MTDKTKMFSVYVKKSKVMSRVWCSQ